MADVLTSDNELTYASFPIEKIEQTADGNVLVWGKATDGSVDSDEQIVDPDFAEKAMRDFFASGPNIRVQHQANRDPAGVGVEWERDGDSQWLKAKVIEPVAKQLVLGGALRAYSVGIARPTIQRDMKARGGRITDGMFVEVSLVDRPANKNCGISLVKGADGVVVTKVFGADDVLAKAMNGTPASQDVTLTVPSDIQMSFSPLDMAKIIARKNGNGTESLTNLITKQVQAGVLSVDEGREKLGMEPFGLPETSTLEKAVAIIEEREYEESFTGKRKLTTDARNALSSSDFVFPKDRRYPIHDRSHAQNALARASGKPEESTVRAAVARRYPGLGKKDAKKAAAKAAAAVANEAIPDMTKPTEKKEKAVCGSCGAMQNNKHAFCSECGKGMAGAMPVVKNHDFMCLGCGKTLDKGEKFCPDCGNENPGYLPEADQKLPANKTTRSRVADAPDAVETAVKGKKKGKGDRVATRPGQMPGEDAGSYSAKGKMKPKKGKKGMPFGGNQAKPFGQDSDDDAEKISGDHPTSGMSATPGGSALKDAAVTSQSMNASGGGAAMKGKKFGSTASPTDGVTGQRSESVPAHREPDGLDVEAFERDAGLPSNGDATKGSKGAGGGLGGKKSDAICVDEGMPGRNKKRKRAKDIGTTTPDHTIDGGEHNHVRPVPGHRSAAEDQVFERDMGKSTGDPQIATNMVLKSLGVSQEDGFLHDLCCPAFSYEDVMKAYPDGLSTFSAKSWQDKALDIAATAPLAQAKAAVMLGQHAYTLKGADVNDLRDVKTDMYKAFRDANPGPGSFPTPGEVRAQSFTRPHITSGRASYGFHYDGPNSAKIPDHSAAASEWQRGFLQSGNAKDSPANKGEGAPYPSETGRPVHLDYSSVHKGNILDALKSMHDHFDRIMPSGVCPLAGQGTSPGPNPATTQKADDEPDVRKDISPDGMSKGMRKKLRKKLTKKVMAGKMPLDTARIRMGKKPKKSPDPLKPQKAAQPDVTKTAIVLPPASKVLTKSDIAAVLRKSQKQSDRKIDALTRIVNALADQPDPGTQPFKGMALNPIRKSVSPAGVQEIASVAERTQMMVLRELEETARNSTDSGTREAAWNQVLKLKGLIS